MKGGEVQVSYYQGGKVHQDMHPVNDNPLFSLLKNKLDYIFVPLKHIIS